MADGLLTGETIESLARQLIGNLDFGQKAQSARQLAMAGGQATKMANHQVMTVVRTSVNQVSNVASQQVYKANPEGGIPTERLPLEERYSARFFELSDVFRPLEQDKAGPKEVPWYYDISTWKGYQEFMGSDHSKKIIRPPKSILSYHEMAKIGQDNENN